MKYTINEEFAKEAYEASTGKPYEEGSATKEYCERVETYRKIAEERKTKVDTEIHEKIDYRVTDYEFQLARWTNHKNQNIIARSKELTEEQEKQLQGWENLLQKEYERIENLEKTIKSVGNGGIRKDDPNALEKYGAQLDELTKENERRKFINKWYKDHMTIDNCPAVTEEEVDILKTDIERHKKPFPILLTNNITRVKKRMKEYQELQEADFQGWEFEDGVVKINREVGRIQIFFEARPNPRMRSILKNKAFRYSSKHKAWQRMLTFKAYEDTKAIRALKPVLVVEAPEGE